MKKFSHPTAPPRLIPPSATKRLHETGRFPMTRSPVTVQRVLLCAAASLSIALLG